MAKKNDKKRYHKYHKYLVEKEKQEEQKRKERAERRAENTKDVDMDDEEKRITKVPLLKRAIRKKFRAIVRDTKKAVRRSMKGGEDVNVGMTE